MGYIGREPLVKFIDSDTTFYVSPSGSDVTGTGSYSKPWLTLHHALDYLGDYFWSYGKTTVTVEMIDGTHDYTSNGPVSLNHVCGGGLKIVGTSSAAPSSVILNFGDNGLSITDNNYIKLLDNFTVSAGTASGSGLFLDEKSGVTMNKIIIENFEYGIKAHFNSSVTTSGGSYPKIKNCNYGLYGDNGAFFYAQEIIITNDSEKEYGIYLKNKAGVDVINCSIDTCNDGIYAKLSTTVYALSATIYDCSSHGIHVNESSFARADYADIDNCDWAGIDATRRSYIYARAINIDHDGVGGDGSYGAKCWLDSHVHLYNDSTIDASGHITNDTSPVAVTSDNPTFNALGSWICDG